MIYAPHFSTPRITNYTTGVYWSIVSQNQIASWSQERHLLSPKVDEHQKSSKYCCVAPRVPGSHVSTSSIIARTHSTVPLLSARTYSEQDSKYGIIYCLLPLQTTSSLGGWYNMALSRPPKIIVYSCGCSVIKLQSTGEANNSKASWVSFVVKQIDEQEIIINIEREDAGKTSYHITRQKTNYDMHYSYILAEGPLIQIAMDRIVDSWKTCSLQVDQTNQKKQVLACPRVGFCRQSTSSAQQYYWAYVQYSTVAIQQGSMASFTAAIVYYILIGCIWH